MDSIKKSFDGHVEEGRILGATCAIFKGEEELFRFTTGYYDVAKTKKLTDNAIFRLASMTKPIHTVAVLIAREKGLLDLDEPISKYIKDFSHSGVGRIEDGKIVKVMNANEFTLRQILSHSSGFGSGPVGDFQFVRQKAKTLEEMKDILNGWYLDFAPGSSQTYSGAAAMELSAYALEQVTQTPYKTFLEEEIFYPLHMKDTTYSLNEEQKSRMVEMCLTGENGLEKQDLGYTGFGSFVEGYPGASAGLFSTLDDYSNFARMLSGEGVFQGKTLLSKESVRLMRTPVHPKTFPGICEYFNWGLGVRVLGQQGESQPLPAQTFGWSGAYGTHFWIEPTTGVSAVLMLNKADVNGAGSVYSAEFERLVERELIK